MEKTITKKKSKKIKITKIPEYVTEQYGIKVGDKFEVIRSQLNEDVPAKMGHLIYTKKNKAIVVYDSEVEFIK